MNDRVSQRPPPPYLGEEELRERYEREADTRGRKLAQPRGSTHGSSADRSEASRHSSIFRFGKSLAASFNPSNWKIWSKQQHEEEETPQQRTLRERQEKAERIYRELKQSGHFRDSNVPPNFKMQEAKDETPVKHDSGVAFGRQLGIYRNSIETSREDKRMGRVFLDPPHFDEHGGSPVSNVSGSVANGSIRKGNTRFKRPSLSSIRKTQGSDRGSTAPNSDERHQARRIPSRKDLQKQQKLVKRVSDLEGKLEAARRQLSEALGEPVPSQMQPPPRMGRPRFVPGALSTLPSERLLSGYVAADAGGGFSDDENFSQIGQAMTTDHMGDDNAITPGALIQSYELEGDTPAASPARVDKPLPKAPDTLAHDRVIQSVEIEATIQVEQTSQTTVAHKAQVVQKKIVNKQPSHIATNPLEVAESLESSVSSEEEGDDFAMEEVTAKTTSSKSKKRKSSFERMANDGGIYKPGPDSESEIDSEVKPKKTPARPRKLQKTIQEPSTKSSPRKEPPSTPAVKNQSSPHNQRQPAPRYRAPSKKALSNAGSAIERQSSKIVKSNIPRKVRQSMSPPPSSFAGLRYTKPSSQTTKPVSAPPTEEPHTAAPSTEDDVPPVPRMPQKVRLPSGEVISTATHPPSPTKSTVSASGKLVKTRPIAKEVEKENAKEEAKPKNNMRREDSFDLDPEIF